MLGRLAARLARVPLVVHTVHGWGFNDRQRPLVHRSFAALERWCAGSFTDALVTVTPRDTEAGLALRIGKTALYSTIRSGIDIARFGTPARSREEVRAELGLAAHHRVAVSVLEGGRARTAAARAAEGAPGRSSRQPAGCCARCPTRGS